MRKRHAKCLHAKCLLAKGLLYLHGSRSLLFGATHYDFQLLHDTKAWDSLHLDWQISFCAHAQQSADIIAAKYDSSTEASTWQSVSLIPQRMCVCEQHDHDLGEQRLLCKVRGRSLQDCMTQCRQGLLRAKALVSKPTHSTGPKL